MKCNALIFKLIFLTVLHKINRRVSYAITVIKDNLMDFLFLINVIFIAKNIFRIVFNAINKSEIKKRGLLITNALIALINITFH